jgi:hypothetical protein
MYATITSGRIRKHDVQNDIQQEKAQHSNSNTYAHRGDFYMYINNISNNVSHQVPRAIISTPDDDDIGPNIK